MKPQDGLTNSLLLLPKYDDIVATCGRTFDVFDLRTSHDIPQISLSDDIQFQPYYLQIFNEDIPVFALASNVSSVSKIDMRFPKGLYTIKLYYGMDDLETYPNSFSACNHKVNFDGNSPAVTAIGHKYGISFYDFDNFGQVSIDQIHKTGTRISNTSAIAFHPEKYGLSFVNNHNFLYYGSPS